MADRNGQKGGTKAPQFFIPASYKGNQRISPKLSTPAVSTSGQTVTPKITISPTGSDTATNRTGKPNDNEPNGKNVPNKQDRLSDRSSSQPKKDNNKSPYLYASPSGVLDLSLYDFAPTENKSQPKAPEKSTANEVPVQPYETDISGAITKVDDETAVVIKPKKHRRFRRPRRNSKLDKLIKFLEDKRVQDDENGDELADLQMPRLRKVLNIIFVTLGVCFLLAVITVILYTTIATENEALNNLCFNRLKNAEGCNQTSSEEVPSDSGTTESLAAESSTAKPSQDDQPSSPNLYEPYAPFDKAMQNPSSVNTAPDSDQMDNRPSATELLNPPDVIISRITEPNEPGENYLHPRPPPPYSKPYEPVYQPPISNQGNYPWSHQRYGGYPSFEQENAPGQQHQQYDNQWWSEYQPPER